MRQLSLYIFLPLLMVTNNHFKAQNFIVKISDKDSIKIEKRPEVKEDGLNFYKNEYGLTLYNKDNILENKLKKYKVVELAGGEKWCAKCKTEAIFFSINKIKNLPKNISAKIITAKELRANLRYYAFGGNYFLIGNTYYKNLGMPTN